MPIKRRAFLETTTGIGLFAGFRVRPAWAQEAREAEGITNCLSLIRNCQLLDGAFRTKADGDPVWIQPYSANHAALALLAGKDKTDRPRVLKWLTWYADHQQADGTIDDFEGSLKHGYRSNGKRDSVDSYAATFLLVVERYQRLVGNTPPRVREAARRALLAIRAVMDDDGLTWARHDYRVKFLMDNLEVYGGLIAAERSFKAVDQASSADQARLMHRTMARRLLGYWQPREKLFAYALDEHGSYQTRPAVERQRRESEGLANLYALAWLSAQDQAPWVHVVKEFRPDGGNAPQAPVERWYIAATRVFPERSAERKDWKNQTVAVSLSFQQDNVYLHRPALTALALLEGPSWLPSLAGGDR